MDAAIRLFSEKGTAATSIADIADAAGVGKGLVNYHFGSKHQLKTAAMHQRLQPFFDQVDQTLKSGDLPGFIEKRFWFMAANPDLCRCIAYASLESDPPVIPGERQQLFADFVRHSSGQNGLRNDLDPMLTVLVAGMAIDGFHRFRTIAAKLFPEELLEPGIEARFVNALLTMIKPQEQVDKAEGRAKKL